MDYKKDSKKKFIITIILVVILNLTLGFSVYFLFNRINLRKDEVKESKGLLSYYGERIENAKKTEKELTKSKKDRLKVESVFLNKESIIDFIEELEYLAKKTTVKLKMKRISVSGVKTEKPSFSFSLEGSFSDIYYYLVLLENDSYQLELETVRVQKIKQTGIWNASLELSLLSFKDD